MTYSSPRGVTNGTSSRLLNQSNELESKSALYSRVRAWWDDGTGTRRWGRCAMRRVTMTMVLAALAATGVADTPRQPPVYSSEVSLVLLPVFVVDHDGRAVRGLRAEDF